LRLESTASWLDKILNDPQLDQATILEQMAASATEFRATILAAELLKQQPPPLQALLAHALVFELPVPYAAIAAVCPLIDDLRQHCERAVALGLLEVSRFHSEANYRVPRLLAPLLPDQIDSTLQKAAAAVLHRLWWTEAETSTEEQGLELHRLALQANSVAIAGVIGAALTEVWNRQNRYREVVGLSKATLAIAPDAIMYYNLAKAEVTLGEVEAAFQHYQQSLTLVEGIGDIQGKAATLAGIAGIYAQQGEVSQALTLYQQSLTLMEGIGDIQGKAAILASLAGIYAQQGDVSQALTLYQQSLTLDEGIGDVGGKAATLHQMAGIYAQQGDVSQALTLYQQSLTLKEGIGDIQGKAATLTGIAGIYAQQGTVPQALTLYQQSLTLVEGISNVRGKAAILANMACWAEKAGDKAQALALNLQAAQALAQSDAYVDLITVLSNLGNTAEDNSPIYLAQAVWLALRVQGPLESTVQRFVTLYQQVPSGDALEALLAAATQDLCAVRGNGHPRFDPMQAFSDQMMAHAAKQQGIETQAAYDTWVNEQQLDEPAVFVPKLQQRLEAIVGDQWLFDRSKLQEVQGDL